MKYLIINYQDMPTPILFPDHVPHSFLCDLDGIVQSSYGNVKIVSAGFVCQSNGMIHAYGGSGHLGIMSHPEDSKLIQAMFGDRDDVFEVIPKIEGVKQENLQTLASLKGIAKPGAFLEN